MSPTQRVQEIGSNSMVRLGTAIALILFVGGGAWKLAFEVAAVKQELQWFHQNMWTIGDMRDHDAQLSALNPTIKTPDPVAIVRNRPVAP